jgi:transcription initiation factor TFIIIB Brf1 subunit/transcription initiation factor TFIIB
MDTYVCTKCGCVVAEAAALDHASFHRDIDELKNESGLSDREDNVEEWRLIRHR